MEMVLATTSFSLVAAVGGYVFGWWMVALVAAGLAVCLAVVGRQIRVSVRDEIADLRSAAQRRQYTTRLA